MDAFNLRYVMKHFTWYLMHFLVYLFYIDMTVFSNHPCHCERSTLRALSSFNSETERNIRGNVKSRNCLDFPASIPMVTWNLIIRKFKEVTLHFCSVQCIRIRYCFDFDFNSRLNLNFKQTHLKRVKTLSANNFNQFLNFR